MLILLHLLNMKNITKILNDLRFLVLDVDGTMTDAGIYYDENGNELKKFSTRDAAGFRAARYVGIEIMVLTGRECKATTRRMQEMKVDYLCQGVKDKYSFLKQFMEDHQIIKQSVGYIGDDINDLSPMSLVGFVGCPCDSCDEVKNIAHYVSSRAGGTGVVRDVVEYILKERGEWENIIKVIYSTGV